MSSPEEVVTPVETAIPAPAPVATETPAPKKSLREQFKVLTSFTKQDKGIQAGAIISGILLGTTALVTPALTGMIGAGVAVAAGAVALKKAWDAPHANKNQMLKKGGLVALGAAGLAAPVLGPLVGTGAALLAGLALLTKTSDTVVNNSSSLGKKAGINPLTLGVGLGVLTSLPELLVSVGAMAAGAPAIGIGNIVGSNIANLLLILGGTAAMKKIDTKKVSWKFNAAAMCASTLVFGAQMVMGTMNPIIGCVLLAGLGGYVWKSIKDAKKAPANDSAPAPSPAPANDETPAAPKAEEAEHKLPKWANMTMGLAGVAGLVGAAGFTVAAATAFGVAAGISPAVIGLLAVAIGTSLPEMMVNFKAARKGETDMAIGNVVGSNIFNLVLIGGMLSLSGAPMPPDLNAKATTMGLVNTLAFGMSALFTTLAMAKNKDGLNKKHGIIGLGLYAAYTAATFILGKGSATPPPAPPPPGP